MVRRRIDGQGRRETSNLPAAQRQGTIYPSQQAAQIGVIIGKRMVKPQGTPLAFEHTEAGTIKVVPGGTP